MLSCVSGVPEVFNLQIVVFWAITGKTVYNFYSEVYLTYRWVLCTLVSLDRGYGYVYV